MKRICLLLVICFLSLSTYSQIVKKAIPDKLIVFTFDDATASQYENVAPLLKRYGFGATFFICEFPTEHESLYMNWNQVRALNRDGFEIASHTRSHPQMSTLPVEKQIEEINYIERKCYARNIPKPISFAYPGYDLNFSTIEILLEKEYKFGRGGGDRAYNPLSDHPLLIPSWSMSTDNKETIMKAFKEAKDGKISVLTIHGVPDIEHPWVNTPLELFEEYLKYLYDNNYRVISLRELLEYIDVDKAMKMITIDEKKSLKN